MGFSVTKYAFMDTVHPPKRQRGRSAVAAGGMPPGKSTSSLFPPPVGISTVLLSYVTCHQCSGNTCREHCPSHSTRGHGSVGRPSAP